LAEIGRQEPPADAAALDVEDRVHGLAQRASGEAASSRPSALSRRSASAPDPSRSLRSANGLGLLRRVAGAQGLSEKALTSNSESRPRQPLNPFGADSWIRRYHAMPASLDSCFKPLIRLNSRSPRNLELP
jgi:hypothetical protein